MHRPRDQGRRRVSALLAKVLSVLCPKSLDDVKSDK
jgi:hypothetical protein